MPLILIEGEYRIANAQPDGDSVRFYPDNKGAWELVEGTPVRANKQGGAQLRLDGIDALEMHFNPEGPHLGTIHQPKDFADAASDALLRFLGFSDVRRDEKGTSRRASRTRFGDTF